MRWILLTFTLIFSPLSASLDAQDLTPTVTQRLIIPYFSGQSLAPYKGFIQDKKIGGILLMGRYSKAEATEVCRTFHSWATNADRPPLIIGVDQEGGRVNRLKKGFPSYPSAQSMAQKGAQAVYEQGLLTGKNLSDIGITMVFAPVLDVRTHPKDTVIADRSYAESPETVSAMGLALFFGLSQHNITAVAKHFPGHGGVEIDSHKALPTFRGTLQTLNTIHRYPFVQYISHSGPALMISHVLYPNLDPGKPASLSLPIMHQLLRKKLGFKGLIITDDIAMGALKQYGTITERIHQAIAAGADYVITSKLPQQL